MLVARDSVAVLLLALLLFVPAPTRAARNLVGQAVFFATDPPILRSHLYEIQPLVVELEEFADRGGAIEPIGENLFLVTPRGRIALIYSDGEVSYLPQVVPMYDSPPHEPIAWKGFRVADVLLKEESPESYRLFVSHHYLFDDCVEFRISSAQLQVDGEGATITGDWRTEFAASPCIDSTIFAAWEGDLPKPGGGIQAGGRMLMDGPEHLLIAIGDHGWYEWIERQEGFDAEESSVVDPDSHLGKLLRIELGSGVAEIVAEGFRNPQGFVHDDEGNLWQTDHGPSGGDELNLVKPGLNYGWPFVSTGVQYDHRAWPYSQTQGRHDGFEKPIFSWVPSIAVSSLIISKSQEFPLWHNDMLVASLGGASLFRLRLHEQRVVYSEKIWVGFRVRDIAQMPDGRIALLTDSSKVLFLQRAPLYCHDENSVESIFSYDADEVCKDVSEVYGGSQGTVIRSLEDADLGDPVIRSLFNVYIYEGQLIYVKSPCSEDDLSHRFIFHVTPLETKDLLEEHEEMGVNVLDSYSYSEEFASVRLEGGCIVVRSLPEYEISKVYTGQVLRVEDPSGEVSWVGPIWDGGYTFSEAVPGAGLVRAPAPPSLAEEAGRPEPDLSRIALAADDPVVRALSAARIGGPAMRSLFNIHVHDNRLIYVKSPCSEYDISHRFFLHVTPGDSREIPEEYAHLGFDIRDFDVSSANLGVDVTEFGCVVVRVLPDYDIGKIYTGQVVRVEGPANVVSWVGPIWEGTFKFSELPALPESESGPSPGDSNQGTGIGAELFTARCSGCHNLTADHSVGPHLEGVIGRRAGSVTGFNATVALSGLDIVWTRENLANFIARPAQFAPGTTMAGVGVSDEEAQIIAEFLAANE